MCSIISFDFCILYIFVQIYTNSCLLSFLDDVADLSNPPDLLEDDLEEVKEMVINRGAAFMLKPAVGSLRAIPRPKKPSPVINGSAPAASKTRTGEKRLKF